ncbi:hypothetical protein TZ00_17835 [Agreia bicolorata]|uniref:DUF1266 domain-containing protein n=1 Tax=Agreia bicolorata TaxID=110935 RepID=A0ABR5CBP9_9MICO|nr:hypothetical protein TZ00_17835 [Agreia bicolorata]
MDEKIPLQRTTVNTTTAIYVAFLVPMGIAIVAFLEVRRRSRVGKLPAGRQPLLVSQQDLPPDDLDELLANISMSAAEYDGWFKDRQTVEGALEGFAETVGVWVTEGLAGSQDVVDAATECIAQGLETPSLLMLASLYRGESWWTVRPLVEGSLAELGLPVLESPTYWQMRAVKLMCREYLMNEITARQLTRWAYTCISYAGLAEAQDLVALDDWFDDSNHVDEAELRTRSFATLWLRHTSAQA